MPRTEGRLFASIWDDDDFVSLSPDAKLLYFSLLSQRDLTQAGTIGLRVVRWARYTRLPADRVDAAVDELAGELFLVVDREEMEVLVRSLIRRDRVYRQPNVFKSAVEVIYMVSSKLLRRALLDELLRLDESEMNAETIKIKGAVVDWLGQSSGNPSPNPSGKGKPDQEQSIVGRDSATVAVSADTPIVGPDGFAQEVLDVAAGHEGSANPSGKGSSRMRAHTTRAQPLSPNPKPLSQKHCSPQAASETDADFAKFWDVYPRHKAKADAGKAFTQAVKKRKADPAEIITAAERFAEQCARDRKDTQFIPYPATWLRREQYNDEPEEQPPPLRLVSGGHQPFRNFSQDAYNQGWA